MLRFVPYVGSHVSDTPQFLPAEDLPRAVAELAETDGWKAALALETAHWDRYVTTHPEALLASIKSLPGDAFVEVPSLLVAVNYLQHIISGVDPRRFHDIAHDDHGRPAPNRQPLDQLIAATGRIAGSRTAGRLDEAARAALDARDVLEQLTRQERAQLHATLPHLLTQWGRAFELADSGGVREYEEAWELANLTQQSEIARRAAASLAWLHADHGRLNEADRWIERAQSIVSPGTRYDAPLYLALAMTAGDRHDASVATHLMSLDSVPIGEYWAAEAWVRAWVATSEHEAVHVESLIHDQLLSHPGPLSDTGANRRYITTARARLATTRHKPAPPLPDSEHPSVFDQVMQSEAAYRSGKMHVVLRTSAPAMSAEHSTRMRIAACLLTAAARLSLGREAAAAEAFIGAHALIEDEQFLNSYSILASEHLVALAALTNLDLHLTYAHPRSGRPTTNSSALASLTRRERQVLIHLASDHSLRVIAETMFISPNTVKGLTSGLYRKLGVHSRREAADIAHTAGLA
jgi:DNA-binding CsgD family transcriptional regulator